MVWESAYIVLRFAHWLFSYPAQTLNSTQGAAVGNIVLGLGAVPHSCSAIGIVPPMTPLQLL